MSNFEPIEVVGHGSETQLQVRDIAIVTYFINHRSSGRMYNLVYYTCM